MANLKNDLMADLMKKWFVGEQIWKMFWFDGKSFEKWIDGKVVSLNLKNDLMANLMANWIWRMI